MICINSVSVTPDNLTLLVDTWYYDATVEICPVNADCCTVVWSSDNTDIVTVNPTTGYIYAKALGSARVYATATDGSGKSDYINVTVSSTIDVSSVTLNRTEASVEVGKSTTLSATVYPENASNKALVWTSSNSNIATVANGVVTAVSEGSAVITATAADGSGKSATCNITVTPEVLVSSINVYPPSEIYSMTVGYSKYLSAVVLPENASNKCVVWTSSNSDIATVNPDSGLVYAQSEGTVTIYATADDGSGVQGSCQLTVHPVIHVTAISLCSPTETLIKNDNHTEQTTLNVAVYPGNATDKTYTLTSSNTNVATVNTATGRVTAVSPGTVTITATTADGGHKDSVTLRVVIDNVTIVKDGNFNNVVFQYSNKVWKCINKDLIFADDSSELFSGQTIYTQRFNFNICPSNIQYPAFSQLKEYSDDEIKLLYAIDPYGVAIYVKSYAEAMPGGTSTTLAYKDHIFELLFNRKPRYYKRYSTEIGYRWEITSDKSNLDEVISESESLFGAHPVWSIETIFDLIKFVFDHILGISIISDTESILNVFNALFTLSSNEDTARNTICSYIADETISNICEAFNIDWAYKWVSMYQDATDIINSLVDCPSFYNLILDYCATDIAYNIYLAMPGQTIKITDISAGLSNLNET